MYKWWRIKRKFRSILYRYLPCKYFEWYKIVTLKEYEYGESIDVSEFNNEFAELLKEMSKLYIPLGRKACIRQASFDYGRMKRMVWYFNQDGTYDRGDTIEIYNV